MSEYTDKIMKIFLNGELKNCDICIVCGRDVRKDTAYYDINGATVCEGCMGVQCKVNNPIKEQEG